MAKQKLLDTHLNVKIDYSRDEIIPEQGMVMLTADGFYKKPWETSPQQGFARAASCYSFGDRAFAQRIYEYASLGIFTNASPVLTNAVEIDWPEFTEKEFEKAGDWLQENVKPDGMPISCFLNSIFDTKRSLADNAHETKWLSMSGGGIGTGMFIRAPDNKSTGVMAHASVYDAYSLAYKQTESRRGSIAMYLNVNHPEIRQFLAMRDPSKGGDNSKKCFNLNHGVTITDSFMFAVIRGEDIELTDPKHGFTGIKVNARELFEEIIQTRYDTGEPYMLFIDTCNRLLPEWITHPHYKVLQSNLCSEIVLRTSEKRTAVCCLSSINLVKFYQLSIEKQKQVVKDLVRYLDNVLEYFIRLAPPELSRAIYSAKKERAIGLGTLGWHSLLQYIGIPFEKVGGFGGTIQLTHQVYGLIKQAAVEESLRLGKLRGEAPDCAGSGMRNSHLLAIAPNASSSSIVNESPSIEPWAANIYSADGRAGVFLIKNKYLEAELEKLGLNTREIWKMMLEAEGSCQHIDAIPQEIRDIFKTAREINPMAIIEQASARQQYLCQAQSINIWVDENMTKQEMVDIHVAAWAKNIKSLYYCRSKKATRANVGTGGKLPLNAVRPEINYDPNVCVACEG